MADPVPTGAGTALGTLAAFTSGITASLLPFTVVRKARLCLLDGIAAILGSVAEGRAVALRSALGGEVGDRAPAPIAGTQARVGTELAALIQGALAAAAVSNDTHLASACHPGMVVVPTVLALASSAEATGADLLAAVVAGYEIMIRLGETIVTPELAATFRPTGLVGPIAAAAAASRLLNQPPEIGRHAMALACNTAGGLNEWARAGTEEHIFHAGFAARDGIVAAQLAGAGFTTASTTLEGRAGLLAAFRASARGARAVADLGRVFRIADVVHKPIPACIFVQAPCQLALALARSETFDPSAIERVEILVSRQAATFPGCDNAGPIETAPAAQQSLQFSVAAVLANAEADPAYWSRPATAHADALARLCHVAASDDVAGAGGSGASVRIFMRGREPIQARTDRFAAMTPDEVAARFDRVAMPLLGPERTRDLRMTIDAVETLPSCLGLVDLLAGTGAS